MLYKYRAVNDYTIDALRQDKCWFSSRYQLNDPYDCFVRLPKAITIGEIKTVLRIVAGRSYTPTGKSPSELLEMIETGRDPLQRLGLIAEYVGDHQLLQILRDHSSVPHAADLLWFAAYSAIGRYFDTTTVLCLTESATNQLMWGNCADSHRGFCVGYRVRRDHPLFPRLRPVEYTTHGGPVDFGLAVTDPVGTRDALVYRKPVDWAYEKEWRITVAGEPVLRDAPLEMVEIICGSAMQQCERKILEEAVAGSNVVFRQLRLAYRTGYDLMVSDQ